MNFVSKFDGSLPFTGTHPKAQTHVESVTTKAPADAIIVPDAQLLFTGDFKKSGADLVISKGDHELRLTDYFKGDKHAPLASADGAYLTGNIVDALVGHVQMAQADGSAGAAKIIGHVTKLTGSASVIRNGVSVILNNGDNVHQGDVVQTGSSSTLGITFIDGSVFGLASNAKMVLNEMVYDPNGSNNSSLMSLVSGTVSFVAGATAKHGDMKVDTPVATMGIRGTACLVEIEFDLTAVQPNPQLAPPVKFQVLVEPDGTTGSYVLLDRTTLAPLATVNQAGTVTTVSGTGAVSFLASAQLSPEVMKLISEVFSQKYTDNSNPKSDTHFTDSVVPDTTFGFKFANGEIGTAVIRVVNAPEQTSGPGTGPTGSNNHIPGAPLVFASSNEFSELDHPTGSSFIDTTSGVINYADVNAGDTPSARTEFQKFGYKDAHGNDVTATLTAEQLAAIEAVTVPLVVAQDPNGKNNGSATWTYNVPDGALDFLAEGETLTLTYRAFVDNNYAPNIETGFYDFTITITGTNDIPTISATSDSFTELDGTGNADIDHAGGTITFADVDLTDRPVVTSAFTSFTYQDRLHTDVTATLTPEQLAAIAAVEATLTLTPAASNANNGTVTWSYDVADSAFDFLADGETLTLTYTATVNDGHGGVVDVPITVTVTGTNDVPTISATSDSFTELDGTGNADIDHAGGTITFADVDLTNRPVVTSAFTSFSYQDRDDNDVTATLTAEQLAAIENVEATLTLIPAASNANNGTVTWSYDVADSAFDFLADGETLTLTYTATVNDGRGGIVDVPITVTVTGTNDLPTISATSDSFSELDGTDNTTIDHAGGTITFADVDLTDRPVITSQFTSFTYQDRDDNDITLSLTPEQLAAIAQVKATLTLTPNPANGHNGSVDWSYDVADSAFDFLADGETLTLVYTATVDDGHGGVVTTPITVSIHGTDISVSGTNDVPTISATSDAFPELDGTGNPDIDHAGGTITFADVDLTDRPVVTSAFTSFTCQDRLHTDVTATLTDEQLAAIAAVKATLTLTPAATNANNGTVTWSYDVADSAFDFLADGEILTLTYTATVNDGHGGVVDVPITVTVTGTNDVPTISATNDAFTELDGTGNADIDHAGGTITFADVDLTDRPAVTSEFTSFTYQDRDHNDIKQSLTPEQLAAIAQVEATLTLTPNPANGHNGSVDWSYDVADSAFDFLADGEILTLTYTATVSDGHGGVVSAPITITITGTNDAPETTSDPQAATRWELEGAHDSDTPQQADGAVTFTDLDLSDVHSTVRDVQQSGTVTGLPTDPSIVKGWLTLGDFTDSTDGETGSQAWSFSAADHYFDYLADGEHVTLTYTIEVDDHQGGTDTQEVTITINGRNDAPVITSAAGASFDELSDDPPPNPTGSSTADKAYGTISFTDLDLSDRPTVSATYKSYSYIDADQNVHTLTADQLAAVADVLDVTQAGGNGNNGSASWTYSVPDSAFDFLGDGDTLVLTYTASVYDSHTTTSTTFDITVHGSNDEPVFVAAGGQGPGAVDSAAITEASDVAGSDTADTASGVLLFTDVDATDTHTFIVTGVTASGATSGLPNDMTKLDWLTLGAKTDSTNGAIGTQVWEFSAADKSFDYLGAGQQVTLTYAVQMDDGHGGIATQDVTVTVTGTNDAPTIEAATLPSAPEESHFDDLTGGTVADLFAGHFDDVDHGASLAGIAIVGNTADDQTQGTWVWHEPGMTDWWPVGTVSGDNALVLPADAELKFVPVHDFYGPAPPLAVVGIDDSYSGDFSGAVPGNPDGTSFVQIDVTARGGSTPYSEQSTTIGTTITAVNDAPVIHVQGSLDIITANSAGGNISVLQGNGSGGFTAAAVATGGTQDAAVTVGDVNGDAIPDILVANRGSDSVSILLGNGSGGFTASTTGLGGGTGPVELATGDFNHDGKLDIVTANGGSNNVSILLGNGSGGFTATTAGIGSASNPAAVAVGDVNGDGNVDVVTANQSGDGVSILLGDGLGGFTASTINTGWSSTSVALGDLNGDGDLDIVTANPAANSIGLLLSDGTGGFTVQDFGVFYGRSPVSVALGDINNDGNLDIVSANNGPTDGVPSHGYTLGSMLGDGDGHFYLQLPALGIQPSSVALGDVNGDGKLDAVVTNPGSNTVTVLAGLGDGRFTGLSNVSVSGSGPIDVAIVNINAQVVDEDSSLVFGASHGNAITISDVDAAGGDETVTLSVAHGALTLGTTANLSVNGNGSGTVVLTGTIASINAALDGLTYAPAPNFNGADPLTISVNDLGHTGSGNLTATTVVPIEVAAVNDAQIAGTMAAGGPKDHVGTLTTVVLNVVDSSASPQDLVFTVTGTEHVQLFNTATGAPIEVGDTFTLDDLQSLRVGYTADPSYVGAGGVSLTFTDSTSGQQIPVFVGFTIFDAQFVVLTSGGYDFDQDNPIGAMGTGTLDLATLSPTSFTISTDTRVFTFTGTGLTYDADTHQLTGGTITSILETSNGAPVALFNITVPAADWYNAVVAYAAGDHSQIEAIASHWNFLIGGNAGADHFGAGDLNDVFIVSPGDDVFEGQFGYDRANYTNASGPIDVQLASGIVTGNASVGTDKLRSIELVTGSKYADTYNAVGFSSTSNNAGSTVAPNVAGMFNEFEGRDGDDIIHGNGVTRVSYYHATAGVTVTLTGWTSTTSGSAGTATGDASTGTDTFDGVYSVRGSFFDDTFTGSNNPLNTAEVFEGLGGNDWIDGGGGFDRAVYNGAFDGVGITVNLAAGTVTGGSTTGTDTLRSIEAIWGTEFADIYNAAGFTDSATASNPNAGSAGVNGSGAAFNEFEGGAGNDTVTGNGNTRVYYGHATGGVVVTLTSGGAGFSDGNASVGHDTFTGGVTRVRGSEFNDIITGNGGNNTLEGQGGNDVVDGRGGNDALFGGTGADIFVYGSAYGFDVINDFNRGQGDRIDLRSAGVAGLADLTIQSGSYNPSTGVFTVGGGSDTRIIDTTHFGAAASLVLVGVSAASLTASDFIFTGQVAVTVQTPDGYDFATLYDDMAGGNAVQAANDATHIFVVNAARGITFELIGTGFTYDGSGHVTGGTITGIDILNTTDPGQTTQDQVLVNSNGWSISAASLFAGVGQYASLDQSTHDAGVTALNAIFNSASYSAVGSAGFADNHGEPHIGADVFFGGDHADVFNGLPGPFDFGNDTVDYSHAASGVSVDLLTGATSGTAAAGDTFISIENLRGTAFDDALLGDNNNNVLEGGLGHNTLDGRGGSDTASYEHSSSGVVVDLTVATEQTVAANTFDTLSNIENLRGSRFGDILTGNGNSILEGGLGNDHLIGQPGQNDTASYEHATGGVFVNLAIQGSQQDTLHAGIDTLTNIANVMGSQYSDILIGNSGDNTLFGNGGSDSFVFDTSLGNIGHDTIGDFMTDEDHILLDYAAFDASSPNDFNTWLAAHATVVNGNDTLIDLNPDGLHPGQQTILLRGVDPANLHASNFLLPQV